MHKSNLKTTFNTVEWGGDQIMLKKRKTFYDTFNRPFQEMQTILLCVYTHVCE